MNTTDKTADPGTISDAELIQGFEQATLKPFHHADHVRVAFAYLCRYPAAEALEKFSTGLRRFAVAQGKPNLYHETITWAYLLLIRERMARGGSAQTWDEFARLNADLLTWKPGILAHYYQPETLASELARTTFIFPDKCSRTSADATDSPTSQFLPAPTIQHPR